jgi:sec-independent protein translocase protein TatC
MLTPPDALSQCMMALPMYVLYEGGILMARLLSKNPSDGDGAPKGADKAEA